MHGNKGWYWLLLLVAAVLTLLYAERRNLYVRYMEHVEAEQEVLQGQERCEKIETETEATRQHLEHLGTDPIEIEAAIRRSKDLVREGEKIYRIEKSPEDTPQSPPALAPDRLRLEHGT